MPNSIAIRAEEQPDTSAPSFDVHPAAAIFPLLTEDDFAALKEDIRQHGQMEDIAVFKGQILDGRNRYRACLELNIEAQWCEVEICDDPIAYVLSHNLHRRHLSAYQRAEIVLKLEPKIRAKAKDKKRESGGAVPQKSAKPPIDTRKQLADLARVSTDTRERVRKIAAKAPEPVKEKLRRGETTINREYRSVVKAEKRSERAAVRADNAELLPTGCNIVTGDFRDEGKVLGDDMVDLIFTDPPYCAGDVGLYAALSAFATRVLRPGGLCLAYSGQILLPDVLLAMRQHLEYAWTCAVRHTGGDLRIHKLNLHNGWKPVVMFAKPPISVWWPMVSDITSGGKEKSDHDWQQAESEASYWIEKLCPANGLVVDPFCGSGTSLAAAKRLGMRWFGFEIDPGVAATARARLQEAGQ